MTPSRPVPPEGLSKERKEETPPVRDREEAIKLDDGWQHIGCPTCGHVDTFPTERLESEGAPWCPHNHSTIVFNTGRHTSEKWTQMVAVSVIPVDAVLGQPDPEVERLREQNDGLYAAVQLVGNGQDQQRDRAERAEERLRAVLEAARAFVDHLEYWESRPLQERIEQESNWRPRSHELYAALRTVLSEQESDHA